MQIAETCTFQCLQIPTRKVEKLKWNFFLPLYPSSSVITQILGIFQIWSIPKPQEVILILYLTVALMLFILLKASIFVQ